MTKQQKQLMEQGYKYYLDNYDKLVELYDGKMLVLVGLEGGRYAIAR